jgi:hypothetical protein
VRGAGLALLLLAQAPPSGALEQLADALAAQARAAGAEAPLGLALSAPGHPALQHAFATVLLSRLSGAGLAPRLLPASADEEAAARAAGARTLLRLRLTVNGALEASGDVLSTWVNFFSGRTPTRAPVPAAALAARVAPDAVVRALAAATEEPALVLDAEPLVRWPVRTAALAAGDLDGDGRAELAVLTEAAVEVFSTDGRLLARRPLDGLPPAETPSREAFGTLCICDGVLYAASASRAVGEVLALVGGSLVPRAQLLRPVVACGHPPLEASFPPGQARLLPAGGPWPELPTGPRPWGVAVRPGAGVLVLLDDGTVRWLAAGAPARSWTGIGAGAAPVDFTGEGGVHLAASSAAAAPAVDRLRLLSPSDGAERGALDVPGQILQVVAVAAPGQGREALVLGVWRPEGGSELRVVRSPR